MLIDLKQSGAERGEWQNLWVSPTTYSLHYNLGAAPRYSAVLLPATSSIPLTSCSWLPYLSHLPGFLILVWESPSVSLSNFVAPANKPHFYFQAGSLFLHFSWSNPCRLCFRQKIPASLLYMETMSALANTVAQREQIYGVNQWNSSGPCVHPISISENFFLSKLSWAGPSFTLGQDLSFSCGFILHNPRTLKPAHKTKQSMLSGGQAGDLLQECIPYLVDEPMVRLWRKVSQNGDRRQWHVGFPDSLGNQVQEKPCSTSMSWAGDI